MQLNSTPYKLTRRGFTLFLLAANSFSFATEDKQTFAIQVWKDIGCGCCKDWVTYLEKNQFKVQTYNTGNTEVRKKLGMPAKYGSCHTALINGYVIEGHVPVSDIKQLLQTKPQAIGIAAPGMPMGSPGMDSPAYGGRRQAFNILLVKADGTSTVFNSYNHS